jgi:hypothetical protein
MSKKLANKTNTESEEQIEAHESHHAPHGFSDHFALGFTKVLR